MLYGTYMIISWPCDMWFIYDLVWIIIDHIFTPYDMAHGRSRMVQVGSYMNHLRSSVSCVDRYHMMSYGPCMIMHGPYTIMNRICSHGADVITNGPWDRSWSSMQSKVGVHVILMVGMVANDCVCNCTWFWHARRDVFCLWSQSAKENWCWAAPTTAKPEYWCILTMYSCGSCMNMSYP